MTCQKNVCFRTRKMTGVDIHAVHVVEKAVFDSPWSFSELYDVMATPHVGGIVCTASRPNDFYCVFGFLLFEIQQGQTQILNMAVWSDMRRCHAGAAMLFSLQSYVAETSSAQIVIDVSDASLGTHLFLRACGYRAIAVHSWRDYRGPYSTYRFISSSPSERKAILSAMEAHSRSE